MVSTEEMTGYADIIEPGIFASVLDHTLLDPRARYEDLKRFLNQAAIYGTNVCINEGRLKDAIKILKEDMGGSNVRIACVAGFPLGATSTKIKLDSIRYILENGGSEVDVVINIGYLKDRDTRFREELMEMGDVVAEYEGVLKVIIETCYLDIGDKVEAARAIKEMAETKDINAFVKTSTGFANPPEGVPKGATVEDIKLIRETLGHLDGPTGIKASGGIRTLEDAIRIMEAAQVIKDGKLTVPAEKLMWRFRIGTSSGHKIMEEYYQLREG